MSSKCIGERIFSIRNKLNLNQRDFAKKLNTSSGYISGIESGKNMAGGEFLLRLNREFGVDLNWLMLGVDLNTEQSRLPEVFPSDLNAEEQKLLAMFRQASELGRAVIMSAARGAEKKEIKDHQISATHKTA